ncbi:MAG: hypothetical protein JWN71_4699 [Xanthobacteraceae bacterium]|jgi:lipid A 4'-phosphatase|nr:hypothetical protein [Xanthobacteraceae bacterium]
MEEYPSFPKMTVGCAVKMPRKFGDNLPIAALLLIGFAAAAIAVASLLAPNMDLVIAAWFFNPIEHRFPAASDPILMWLRDLCSTAVIAVIACMVVAVVTKLLVPSRPLLIPGRAIIFLTVTLALGPGILVNGIFKPHSGRPRPVEVTQFAGNERFVAWWNLKGTCESNCSLVSGEAAAATWMLGPAILVPPPWRVAAVGAALIFTVAISGLRMAFGGHFLTDVVFGALLTALVIWLMHGLIFRWTRTRLNEQAIDGAIGKLAFGLRRVASRVISRRWRRPGAATGD